MNPDDIPNDVRSFLAYEVALRAVHGEGALYVKPLIYEKEGHVIAVGGWAYLDGEPAMLSKSLDLLTVTYDAPDGTMKTVGRDPRTLLALLGDRVRTHASPCPHVTVTVKESEKSELIAKIVGLPEHDPTRLRRFGAWALVGLMALVILGVAATLVLD